MEPTPSKYKDLGPLHQLLLKVCPPDERGRQSIPALADALGITHQYVYKWISTDKVPANLVSRMVEMSEGRVAITDFHPYVF